jgi:peptidase A4-like protein
MIGRSVLVVLTALALTVPSFAPAAAAVVHRPRVPVRGTVDQWASSNWSGYAITTGAPFMSVTGTWVVQAVSPTKKSTYSSQWVGIDGFNDNSLIQTGTESDYHNGSAHYGAWWEILPAAETVIPSLAVKPGDLMSASITQTIGTTSWTITLTDVTTGQSFSTVQTYTGPQTSAEWIEEAPTVNGRVAPLAHYYNATTGRGTPVSFDSGAAAPVNTANGSNPGLTTSESGVMIQQNAQVSTPSAPDSDTDGFNMEYGSKVPNPPPS